MGIIYMDFSLETLQCMLHSYIVQLVPALDPYSITASPYIFAAHLNNKHACDVCGQR